MNDEGPLLRTARRRNVQLNESVEHAAVDVRRVVVGRRTARRGTDFQVKVARRDASAALTRAHTACYRCRGRDDHRARRFSLRVVPAEDVVELVNRKVHDKLALLNGRLEQLVAEAVDAELGRLVDVELDRRINGDAARVEHDDRPVEMKVCSLCGVEKPADEFEPGRRRCRSCRREQRNPRRRKADAAKEED